MVWVRWDGLVGDVFPHDAIDEFYLDIAKRSLQGYAIATVCPGGQADNKYFLKLQIRLVTMILTSRRNMGDSNSRQVCYC